MLKMSGPPEIDTEMWGNNQELHLPLISTVALQCLAR